MLGPASGPPVPPPPTSASLHPLLRIRLGPLLAVAVVGLGAPLAAGWARRTPPVGHDFIVVASAVVYGLFVAWLAFALPRAGVSWSRLIGRAPGARAALEILLVAWMHILFAANSFVLMLAVLHRVAPRLARELAEVAASSRTIGSARLVLMTVVVAPVVEELLFRGVLLQRLALRWGAPRAIFVTSAIFALLHPQHPLGLFVFSLLLSLLFLSSGSLITPILAHALTNGTLLVIAHLAEVNGVVPAAPDVGRIAEAAPAAAVGVGLVGLFIALYLLRRWPPRGAPIPYDAAVATPPAESLRA